MGPLSYMRSVVDRNVVMRRIPVLQSSHSYVAADPLVTRSKALIYGRSLAGNTGSKPAGGMDVCLL